MIIWHLFSNRILRDWPAIYFFYQL